LLNIFDVVDIFSLVVVGKVVVGKVVVGKVAIGKVVIGKVVALLGCSFVVVLRFIVIIDIALVMDVEVLVKSLTFGSKGPLTSNKINQIIKPRLSSYLLTFFYWPI
jgi:hypothetical protein